MYATNMNATASASRPPNPARRAKATDRPSEYREKLLAAGKELFVDRGLASVSVEEVVERAGVSRATFYGLFANKIELAAAILTPVFADGARGLAQLTGLEPRAAADGLIDVYLALWRDHEAGVLLTTSLDGEFPQSVRQQHDAFVTGLLAVLRVIDSGGLLRNDSVELTCEILARTGIPLLRVYAGRDDMVHLYGESMRGLLIRS
ncbi:MAG: TetR/AcrR family transcriptional regulator [Gammaproteobacteria bacterium]|nr:TetR/AcrR family transcriptional regulator [Gammaproteobacteria bacterium]NND35986.1 TetR/AcrR family transcriptional regulator [Gammaproteobacteria bacterium]